MKWVRFANYLQWRFAETPVLLNRDTWELRHVSFPRNLPKGTWLLRRPLTLPESTMPLFLDTRVSVK
jgi:hypothetical protein